MGSVVPTNDTQYCSSCWNLGFSFALLTWQFALSRAHSFRKPHGFQRV